MPSDSLKTILIEEIKDLYHAEGQLVKALPKLADAAINPRLKEGLLHHLEETRGQVTRLEQVFEQLQVPVKAKTCPAMKGLIEEANERISEHESGPLRDALIIGAAQRVEHYEIAAYGTARAYAEELGEDRIAALLDETLEEEGAADRKLTEISETVNSDACAPAGDLAG
ncbi:MAG: ferritin-like domain-containing protein [Opitutaceae bacterium]|nr:ferritin-like domain-containing protein [Opitutaceae bacterium]